MIASEPGPDRLASSIIRCMKERYFTPENREASAEAMLLELYPSGQKRRRPLAAEHAALLALDLQQYFLDPESHAFVPSAPIVLAVINTLAREFHSAKRPIIYSKHLNTERDAGSLSVWWQDLITEEHPQHSLHPSLDLTGGEVLTKSQYDAFYRTDLEERLRALGVRQVVVGGVMTHLCCETTARSAFVRGFDVFFLVDGTATYRRDLHLGTLRNLGHGFASLVTINQVVSALQR